MEGAQEIKHYRTASTGLPRPGLRPFSRRNRPAGARNSDSSSHSHSRLVAYSASDIYAISHHYPSANGDSFEPAAYPHAHNAAANTNSYYSAAYANAPANCNPAAHQRLERGLPGRLAVGVSH